MLKGNPSQVRSVEKFSPRTLYIARYVKNPKDIIRWAKEQGFKTTLEPDDMHVTIAHSRQKLDWNKVGSDIPWGDYKTGEMSVRPGGPRVVEPLGDKGAVALLFSDSSLTTRHNEIKRAGATWDYPGYQPHITITYDQGDVDLDEVEPYTGPIELGPEIFAEVDDEWSDKITEKAYRESYERWIEKFDPSQPRDDQGQWTDSGGGGSSKPRSRVRRGKIRRALNAAFAGAKGVGRFVENAAVGAAAAAAILGAVMFALDFANFKAKLAPYKRLDAVEREKLYQEGILYVEEKGVSPKFLEAIKQQQAAKKREAAVQARRREFHLVDKAEEGVDNKLLLDVLEDLSDEQLDVVMDLLGGEPMEKAQEDFEVVKVDKSLGLVFGWSVICKRDGKDYYDRNVDKDGERVPEHVPEQTMLEAATDFMQNSRVAKEMHGGKERGTVVFMFPLTTDIAKALGIKTPITGLLTAMKPDKAMLEKFASGELTGFSIGGSCEKSREEDYEDA